MSNKILRIVGLADGRPSVHDGLFVTECDVDARDGRGAVYTTPERREARQFPGTVSALEYWKRQSKVTPLRDDGQPNRPLTAYSVEVENL